jgi:hypothetical protein
MDRSLPLFSWSCLLPILLLFDVAFLFATTPTSRQMRCLDLDSMPMLSTKGKEKSMAWSVYFEISMGQFLMHASAGRSVLLSCRRPCGSLETVRPALRIIVIHVSRIVSCTRIIPLLIGHFRKCLSSLILHPHLHV